jgi:L-cysteine desulfidase
MQSYYGHMLIISQGGDPIIQHRFRSTDRLAWALSAHPLQDIRVSMPELQPVRALGAPPAAEHRNDAVRYMTGGEVNSNTTAVSPLMSDFLAHEWCPALGCTEPACIAYAAATAASESVGTVESVEVTCDPRMYKNCFAVGIPHSGHRIGLRWALSIGALLPDPSAGLEIFRQCSPEVILAAGELIERGVVHAHVDVRQEQLYVDCTVHGSEGTARAVIAHDHTRIMRVERNGIARAIESHGDASADFDWRARLAAMDFAEMQEFARSCEAADRERLRRGIELNTAIAKHGLSLLPERFVRAEGGTAQIRGGRLVCAGVYARMWGEDFTVMSLAGSGNKGITCAVPLAVRADEMGAPDSELEDALAVACLGTSATTHHPGPLSAVCGCSNAAGIGLAAGLVHLEGGDAGAISLAVTNMVGNVAGMVCDGAKIGCAMKTMTAVDAAFRSAAFALSGLGIPESDGIVGCDGCTSLANLGRVAVSGMASMDAAILGIMSAKMEVGRDA